MAKTNQNDSFYANNKQTLVFTIVDTDQSPNVPFDLTGCLVQWALSKLNQDGSYSTTNILKKNSGAQGGVSITDVANGIVTVTINPADTANLSGKYYQELEVVDNTSEPIVVATGYLTINKNVNNA